MSSRSRRDTLSNVESLILAQAVWEHGANAWQVVAKVLSNHSLISRPKSFFTAQSSQVMYQNLMQEAGLERTEACDAVHSPVNHKLAEKYYIARVRELRELILVEEEKFKAIVSEIDAIRAGSFDAEITAKITGIPVGSTEPTPETQAPVITPSDELFGGSDLSGVSVTPSRSQTQEIPVSNKPAATCLPQQQHEELGGSLQTPIVLQDTPTDILTPVAADITPRRHVEREQTVTETNQPSFDPSKPASCSPTPTVRQVTGQAEEHMVNDLDKTRGGEEEEEEEEEDADENEVVNAVSTTTPVTQKVQENVEFKELTHEENKSKEKSSPTPETLDMLDGSKAQLAPVQDEIPESDSADKSNAEAEVVDDGDSSGEEPLTASRRSTRRRRSTLSPVQQVQVRGKGRRQKHESPINNKDESEVETEDIEELQDEITKLETDRDASPILSGVRRGQGKRKASFIESVDSPRDKKRARDDSEPVDEDETGQTHGRGRRPGIRSEGHKRFQAVIGMLHSQISQHRNGNIFHNPIKNSEAPDYHEIVKRPMDLKTIKMRVKDGSIGNSLEYQRDIMLMFANAMMYNRPGSDVHAMAEDMMVESEGHINAFRQTEGLVRSARHV